MKFIIKRFWLLVVILICFFAFLYILQFTSNNDSLTNNDQNTILSSVNEKTQDSIFLEENIKKDGVLVTPTGLQYKVLQSNDSTEKRPTAQSAVTVNYEGSLVDGKVFDSSYERGEPITFQLNQVIPGWTEGLQLMRVGEIFEFYIPSDLGYGPQGNPVIPGGATLIFKVELLDIN